MSSGDFELGGYLMGRGRPAFVTDFQPGSMEDRIQDKDNPVGNNVFFGRDQAGTPAWSFTFSISHPDGATNKAAGVLDTVEDLLAVWRPEEVQDPGWYTTLRYEVAGRSRLVYGRPRNFALDPSQNLEDGNVTASAQFKLLDALTYDADLDQVELMLRQAPTGAVTLPAVWPLTTTVSSTRQGLITPGGKARRYFPEDITFYGPVNNPALASSGWTVQLNTSIPYDGWIRVRPRDNTVLTKSGGSAAGALSRNTYLPDVVLTPGSQDLTFTGEDPTATARAVVRWRPAYYGI